MTLKALEAAARVEFTDYQVEALTRAAAQPGPSQRRCLYYRTGAGKTLTALAMVAQWGHQASVVIAPPSTHSSWQEQASRLGLSVTTMSHAKFRMKDTKLQRDVPVIADEFHLFGGHQGQGWKKLERLSRGLQAPLVLASATPNYNDAERCYCIQRILDPAGTKGGFLEFLYQHCTTEQNPFGMTPNVTGFQRFTDAAEFLSTLANVDYLPDELVYTIKDRAIGHGAPVELNRFGYYPRRHRIAASIIELKHMLVDWNCIADDGCLTHNMWSAIQQQYQPGVPMLLFANHSTVAVAAEKTFRREGIGGVRLVTGSTSATKKQQALDDFRNGDASILIGTASLATGTDGLDKVCDLLIILDDTDDDALRRQVIGRIMPRGLDTDASKKRVIRLLQ